MTAVSVRAFVAAQWLVEHILPDKQEHDQLIICLAGKIQEEIESDSNGVYIPREMIFQQSCTIHISHNTPDSCLLDAFSELGIPFPAEVNDCEIIIRPSFVATRLPDDSFVKIYSNTLEAATG